MLRDPRVSPLHAVAKPLPSHVVCGAADPLVDQAESLDESLEGACFALFLNGLRCAWRTRGKAGLESTRGRNETRIDISGREPEKRAINNVCFLHYTP